MTGAYHAAKFGIEAVGDVFRQELRPLGHLGLDRRAGLDRDRRSGTAASGPPTRSATALPSSDELYGEAIEKYRKVDPGRRRTRGIPPEKVGQRDRARAHRPPPAHALPGRPRRQGPGAGQAT